MVTSARLTVVTSRDDVMGRPFCNPTGLALNFLLDRVALRLTQPRAVCLRLCLL